MGGVRRTPGTYVKTILDPGHYIKNRTYPNRPPYYPTNLGGQHEVLPTLVCVVNTEAFRAGERGSLGVRGSSREEEPSPDERERILGYSTGATRAPGIDEVTRHQILGQCIDARCLQSLVAIPMALYRHRVAAAAAPAAPAALQQEPRPAAAASTSAAAAAAPAAQRQLSGHAAAAASAASAAAPAVQQRVSGPTAVGRRRGAGPARLLQRGGGQQGPQGPAPHALASGQPAAQATSQVSNHLHLNSIRVINVFKKRGRCTTNRILYRTYRILLT